MLLPKIIHHTGPFDKKDWHPLWLDCQESWLKNFSNYDYKFWTDEDIDRLVFDNYNEYWEMYTSFPVHIMKIDFARLCMMHKFGGIYSDLDVYCYKNFDHLLTKESYVVENPFGNDPIENSLMCSKPNSEFFKLCMETSKKRFFEVKRTHPEYIEFTKDLAIGIGKSYIIFYVAGPNLVSTVYRNYSDKAERLCGFQFNNLSTSYDETFYTKHIHTNLWGKDMLERMNENGYKHVSFQNISIDKYDFYTDYSDGAYKNYCALDISKNDVQAIPITRININYK